VTDDDYLWEKKGPPDADVERLERVLRPLGRRDDAPIATPARRPRLFLWAALAAAAAVIVAVTLRGGPEIAADAPVVATGPKIHDATGDAAVGVGEWIETKDADRQILVGDLGRLTLAAQSRLQVRHVSDEETRLYLARGSMEAFVSAEARPRFFQVDTDAARCVDLGCRYTLDVAPSGDATVRVVTGQVAFETPTREVFVPAGAVAVARKGRGPGTPRFEDARETLVAAFDAYDAARESSDRRRELALVALDAVTGPRDTLPAWHLLQDPDAEVVRAAAARLEALAGQCGLAATATPRELRDRWKERLATQCW
jgi:FecR protein